MGNLVAVQRLQQAEARQVWPFPQSRFEPEDRAMRRVLALALGAAAVVLPIRASAQSSTAEADAQLRFREGVTYFEHHDFDRASGAFDAAWKLTHDERFLWNEALSELNAGRHYAALKLLEKCRSTPTATGEHATQIEIAIRDARTHVTQLVIKAPQGAIVLLDGERAGISPLSEPLAADPSAPHTIVVTLGDARATRPLPVMGATLKTIEFQEPPPKTTIESAPSTSPATRSHTRVIVAATLLVAAVAAGTAAVVYRLESASEVDRGATLRDQIPPIPNRPSNSWCYKVSNQPCSDLQATLDSANADQTRSYVFAVAGGVLGASAIATWLFWPRRDASTAAVIVPEIDRSRAGASVLVRF